MVPVPKARIGAVVEEATGQRLGDRRERGPREVRVVALRFTGHRGVQGMVEVVVPLRVQPQAALRAGGDHTRVVQVGLGDQEQRPARLGGQRVDGGRQFLQEVARARVLQRVHRVQPQPVDPVLAQPRQRAAQQERAHLVRAGRVQVDRAAPGGLVRVREVRAERGQVVPGRAEVVVHHVEHDSQAQFVGPVDEPLESLGAAVGLVHGPQRDALVAPAVPAGERAQGHQLDVCDAQFDEMAEPVGRRVQGALGRVRADVQLVEHRSGQRAPGPRGTPRVPLVVDDRAQPVRAVRLPAGARVGQRRAVVHREPVPRAVLRLRLAAPPPHALGIALQRARGALAMERHTVCLWCPHLELHGRFPFVCSPGCSPSIVRQTRSIRF